MLINSKLTKMTWPIIISTTVLRLGYFTTMPFLSLVLAKRGDVNYTLIGVIVSCGSIAGVVTSFLSGYFSDYLGRFSLLMTSLFFSTLLFFLFPFFESVPALIILNTLLGMSVYLGDPIIQTLLADLNKGEMLARALSYRYMFVNVSAGLATLLGGSFARFDYRYCFFFSGTIYLVVMVVLYSKKNFFPPLPIKDNEGNQGNRDEEKRGVFGIFQTIKGIIDDKAFFYLLLSFSIVSFSISHMSATLALHLGLFFAKNGPAISIFTTAQFLNAFLVVALQSVIISTLGKMGIKRNRIAMYGMFFFVPAFLSFAFATTISYTYYLGIFFITMGEILIFPTLGVLIEEIAPPEHRGAYYGALSVSRIGGAMSGFFGGLFLEHLSVVMTWMTILFIHLGAIYFHMVATSFSKNKLNQNQNQNQKRDLEAEKDEITNAVSAT